MTNKEKIRAFLVGMADANCCVTSVAKAIEKNILPYIDSLEEDAAPLTQENSTPLSGGGRADGSAQEDPVEKVWHDANETPKTGRDRTVLVVFEDDTRPITFTGIWEDWKYIGHVWKWAYVKDLLKR